jgi:hypothetical protein
VCDTPSLNEQLPPAANERTAFVRGANVPPFVEQLFAYADDATAQQVLSSFDASAQSCTSFDQNGYHFTIGQLSFPSMGDQTISYRLTGTQGGPSVTGDLAIERKSTVILYTGYLGLDANTDEAGALTAKAYDKATATLGLS